MFPGITLQLYIKAKKQPELDYDVTIGQQAQISYSQTDYENMNF